MFTLSRRLGGGLAFPPRPLLFFCDAGAEESLLPMITVEVWTRRGKILGSSYRMDDYSAFRAALRQAKHIIVLAGAGLSAASGWFVALCLYLSPLKK